MKKPKKLYFKVYDSIFNQVVHCMLNFTVEDYRKWLNKNKIEDIAEKSLDDFAGWCAEITAQNGRTERVIYLPKFNWTIKQQGTLIHEITHAVIKIWEANNIPFNPDTQEFLAHSIGNMFEDIAHSVLKHIK